MKNIILQVVYTNPKTGKEEIIHTAIKGSEKAKRHIEGINRIRKFKKDCPFSYRWQYHF